MKEFKFLPKVDGVTGHVLLKVPGYMERMKIAQKAGISSEGNIDIDKVMALMGEMQKYILSVDIKVGTEKCTDIEDLGMYQAGVECINACVAVLSGGIPTPKKS